MSSNGNGREILIYLSYFTNGNWNKMLSIINRRELEMDDEKTLQAVSKMKCKAITMLDEDYPVYLKSVYKPPIVLFYYGDIELLKNPSRNVAVVGSRQNSEYGAEITRGIVKDVAKNYNIVSGMALGIDSIAHEACLEVGGKTIAVLGSGIDSPYPKTNEELYQKIIKEGGLIISEYPGDLEPLPEFFPARNRIIAGLSQAVLITEAKNKSGTSITAHLALMLGKEVMCVPTTAGQDSLCNALIRDGASLVECSRDVYDNLGVVKMW